MKRMLQETDRRRTKQIAYNEEQGIVPKTIFKSMEEVLASTSIADVKAARDGRRDRQEMPKVAESVMRYLTPDQKKDLLDELKNEMRNAAKDLEFERAAELRDEIERLEKSG
jgi:excinuclease ABC subunit B